ncbi:hypothetical protein PoB_005741900 [Plakobranchus ocellatus]|uniref:Uncharacterized protein n=1 Tax=Plakobranchus ocellatus TaxID=259542 RepID=A0AAV4CJ87_9GAST|nr:hypothetical protein PoB_005741900 [Plakobranchus ocellatus]
MRFFGPGLEIEPPPISWWADALSTPPRKEEIHIKSKVQMFLSEDEGFRFLYIASPQQGDLRLSGPPSDQGAGDRTRTRDSMVPAYLRAYSVATVPPKQPKLKKIRCKQPG